MGCLVSVLLFVHLVLFGVLLSSLGILRNSTLLVTWFFLVLGRLCSLGYLKPFLPGTSLSLFFLCSSLGSLIYFLTCALDSYFSHLSGVGLLLSMGLPPFQYWALRIVRALEITHLFIFLVVMKGGYLFLYISRSRHLFCLSLISLILGVQIIYASTSLSYLIFGSSAMNLIIFSLLCSHVFVFYYLVYLLSFFRLVIVTYRLISPIIAFSTLAGLPPLGIFWAKVIVLQSLPLIGSILVLLISVSMFYPYLSLGIHDTRSVDSNPMLVSLLLAIPIILFLVITVLIAW